MWVGKGICPGQKLVVQMVLHMFQNFNLSPFFTIEFVVVESCRELQSLMVVVWFPPEGLDGPDLFQPCCSWVDPSFTSPGVVGGSLCLLLNGVSLLRFMKENKWICVN